MKIGALFQALRPKQWAKNLFVLAPVIFTGHAFSFFHWGKALAGFSLFSLAASALYLLNDLVDKEKDKLHPQKKERPLARGELSGKIAFAASLILILLACTGSLFLNFLFFLVILIYLGSGLSYTFLFREIFLLDIMTVSFFYLLRVLAGVFLMEREVSPWILATTFFLALFLSSLKRFQELQALQGSAEAHRSVLQQYTFPFLHALIQLFVSLTIITYALYTFLSQTARKAPFLMFTTLFVIYGLLRFWYVISERKKEESLEEIVLHDLPLLVTLGLWAISCVFALIG